MSETSTGENHPFLWTKDKGMIDLGSLGGNNGYPMDINNNSEVVGASSLSSGEQHAFLWTESAGIQDLNIPGDTWSVAKAINDSGKVVGTSNSKPFSWMVMNGAQYIGSLGGYGEDINYFGTIVGSLYVPSLDTLHPFMWTTSDGMIDLDPLSSITCRAEGINDLGWIVGSYPSRFAFMWKPDQGLLNLPIPGGEIQDINNAGWIVGGFLWTPDNGYINLGTLGGDQHTHMHTPLMILGKSSVGVTLPFPNPRPRYFSAWV